MLNIRKLFSDVCYDCIDIIIDYIDIPHDILKLIYYNKYYLYYDNDNQSINKTEDPIQLLLYKKFYEKVIQNMNNYTSNHGAKWNDIVGLLDDKTVITGGSILQSIYGDVHKTTEISSDFYFKEYLNIHQNIENKMRMLAHLLKNHKNGKDKKNGEDKVITHTDIDIFTITDEKIFNNNNIIESCTGKGLSFGRDDINSKMEVYYMENDNHAIVLDIYIPTIPKTKLFRDTRDLSKLPNNIHWNYCCQPENKRLLNLIQKKNNDIYISFHYGNKLCDTYKIFELNQILDMPSMSENLLYYLTNNNHMVQKVNDLPAVINKFIIMTSHNNEYIMEYLFNNNDNLLKKIHNQCPNLFDRYEPIHPFISSKIDNSELRSSMYNIYGEHNFVNQNIINYEVITSTTGEKKIIPLVHCINDLLLNLVYINSNIHVNPVDFIENNFDIDICKLSFNGKKIKLYSIGNLVHKRFKYNIDHIMNSKITCNSEKYIHFKKRVEKYKSRGFVFLNEYNTVNRVKNILNISHAKQNIELLKRTIEKKNDIHVPDGEINILKRYYEYAKLIYL